ncbi:MAG: hypothetical protein HF973_14470 [Chloroflexi bacterium]|nr:hypothetical protein [Chloroflexota bacterium]
MFRIDSVVALVARQAKEALLEDGVLLIPQGHAQADVLEAVADAADAVFIPAVSAAMGLPEAKYSQAAPYSL